MDCNKGAYDDGTPTWHGHSQSSSSQLLHGSPCLALPRLGLACLLSRGPTNLNSMRDEIIRFEAICRLCPDLVHGLTERGAWQWH